MLARDAPGDRSSSRWWARRLCPAWPSAGSPMTTTGDRPHVVLVVDDDPGVGVALQLLFDLYGLVSEVARAPGEALARVRSGGIGVVIHDMNFTRGETSGDEGLAFFRDVRREAPAVAMVLMTSWHAAATRDAVLRE